MGLFSYAIGRRSGAKKAEREAEYERARDEEICRVCGHRRRQHSDSGQCPRYS